MKTSSIILFCFLWCSAAFGQSDTIRLQKIEYDIFRCTNPTANNWYLYLVDNRYYLVNLNIKQDDVLNWCKKYTDSQNLYSSAIIFRNQKEFFNFRKPNYLDEQLFFEILRRNSLEIITQSIQTGEEFCFNRLEF